MIDEKQKWKAVTCKEAQVYSENGYLVWWRPSGILDRDLPDEDIAWVLIL